MSFKAGDDRHDFQATCPYNPAHKMPHSRLYYHIVQGCVDKEAQEQYFAHCPFDFLHVVPKAKLDDHILKCQLVEPAK